MAEPLLVFAPFWPWIRCSGQGWRGRVRGGIPSGLSHWEVCYTKYLCQKGVLCLRSRDSVRKAKSSQSRATHLMVIVHWVCILSCLRSPFESRDLIKVSPTLGFVCWSWHKPHRCCVWPSLGSHGWAVCLSAWLSKFKIHRAL